MKVVFGKYPTWYTSGLYDRWYTRRYGEDFLSPRDPKDFWDKAVGLADNYFDFVFYPFNRFLQWKGQKIKVVIQPHDTWSFDYTLAYIIAPGLKQLKATKHGAPMVDQEDVPEELRDTVAPEDGDVGELHFQRWDWILDEMIWAVESILNEPVFDKNTKDEYYAFLERQQRGLEFFGKYFRSLWD